MKLESAKQIVSRRHIIGFKGTTKHGLLLEHVPVWSLKFQRRLIFHHPNAIEDFFRLVTSISGGDIDKNGEIITVDLSITLPE